MITKRTLCAVGLAALCLTWAAPAGAQVPDHLKCYKVKDPQAKATYTGDLDVPDGPGAWYVFCWRLVMTSRA